MFLPQFRFSTHDHVGREASKIRRKFSDEQLRDILDRIDDGFYAVGADWRFTYVNQKARNCWDRDDEELIGRHIWEEFPPAVGTKSYREHHRALRTQQTAQFETNCPASDGWIEVFIYPNENGLSVQFRDISAKKKAQQKLRRSGERYRRLFETAHEAIVISTPAGFLRRVVRRFSVTCWT